MSAEVKKLINELKSFVNGLHQQFENNPIVQDRQQYEAWIESSPNMRNSLRQIKKDEEELNEFIEKTFNSDLVMIETLEKDNKDLAEKITKYSAAKKKKVLDKLNERVGMVEQLVNVEHETSNVS